MEPHDEGANGQHADGKSTLPATTSDTERNEAATDDDRACPKIDELVATVHGLVERERLFFERLANIEKLMSSYIDELYCRLREEKCAPPAMDLNGNSNAQHLQPESGTPTALESIHRKD
uniref:Uncharacterized protein n=1 Tax=Anopheles maculatus TaxID=74869 RepID=A0A182SRX5_9DIPT